MKMINTIKVIDLRKKNGFNHKKPNNGKSFQNKKSNDFFDFLRQSQTLTFNHLSTGYLTLDHHNSIRSINQAGINLLEIDAACIIGRLFSDFVHVKDLLKVERNFENPENNPSQKLDIRLKNKNCYFWARLIINSENPSGQKGNDTIITFIDISDLKKAAKETRELKNLLMQAQKLEIIGSLSCGIAHDFNNIIHLIVGNLEILMDQNKGNQKSEEIINKILSGTDRAADLVKQIIGFNQQTNQTTSKVEIQQVISEVIKLSHSALPSTVIINQEIDRGCIPIIADPTHIYQVAINLITNAFQSLGPEGGKIDINLYPVQVKKKSNDKPTLNPGHYICLDISDNGEGIDSKLEDKIFSPYFTTKGNGTGLGLYVISNILKQYSGDIFYKSKVGQGSQFLVYFPVNHEDLKIDHTYKTIDITSAGNEDILFVDDDPVIAKMQQNILERYGYNVQAFTSSLAAYDSFKKKPEKYDIAICGMTMPDITGLSLSSMIKQIRPDLPVIICTGYSEQINKDNYNAYQVDGFLMKPFRKNELFGMVRNILDLRPS